MARRLRRAERDRRRGVRRLAAAIAAAAGFCGVSVAGAAPLTFRDCPRALPGFECAELRVPLDRSGATPGTVALRVARERRAPAGGRVLVALSGGPGQGSVAFAPYYPQTLAPARSRYRLVVIDQRGTGDSGVLRCPRLQRVRALDPDLRPLSARCAGELGRRRAFYSTTDSVDDLEDLRVGLAVDRLALQGTSYGTYVAAQYARRYPDRTDRLVLDSSIGPDGVDRFLLDSWAPLPRILREQCAAAACAGITNDPVADVRALAARLERSPLRGRVVDARGRRRTVRLGGVGYAALLMSGDLNAHLQAAIPAATRSALAGDAVPLLRLVEPAIGPPYALRELSLALNVATTCADTRLSYALTTPLEQRAALTAAALAAVPEAALGPFSRSLVRQTSVDEQCLEWPVGPVRGPIDAPLPAVPTLLLGGSRDVRTPVENDRAVAAQIPGSQLVVVPGGGHDAIDTDASGCVRRALRRFFADRPVGDPCAGADHAVPAQPVAPTSLAAVTPAPGTRGARGRVLAAVVGTVDDTRETLLELQDAGLANRRGGGLRAGTWSIVGASGLTLRGVSWVPGVTVSGRLESSLGRYDGAVRVRAPRGLGGTLRFDRRRGVTGALGGRPVRLAARYARGAVAPSALRAAR
jgi:pimeloyl-ACP methyl ester carboxylesterase